MRYYSNSYDQVTSKGTMLSTDVLQSLGADLPRSGVTLLRLRLRFGSPRCVVLGTAFRICVDVVDEMARPPSAVLADSLLNSGFCLRLTLYNDSERNQVTMSSRPLGVPSLGPGGAIVTRFDCVLSSPTDWTGVFRLKAIVDRLVIPVLALSPSHETLQSFCMGSEWFVDPSKNTQTLVLPVISDEIHVGSSPGSSSSSRCLRIFSLPNFASPLHIQEDYGHAMGSHVWDASIWLSFSLVLSPWSKKQHQMVELGAGSGLLAVVYAKMRAVASSRMLLTDRGDTLASLEENIQRNGIVTSDGSVSVRELVWGDQSCCLSTRPNIVYAADVLYHWSGHEALLATLLDLVPVHSGCVVIIAHKHRGNANAKNLDGLFAFGFDRQCDEDREEGCSWTKWRVERLARVTDIEFLKLTRHQRCIDSTEEKNSV